LNQTSNEFLVYALLLPILIAAILGGILLYAAGLQKIAADTLDEIRTGLESQEPVDKKVAIKDIPDLELLYILLQIFGWVFFLVGFALIVTPFLKAAPFQWWQCPPKNLVLFAFAGSFVLVGAGWGTYCFACRYDKKAKEQRSKKSVAKQLPN
jgi:hypothetical protein